MYAIGLMSGTSLDGIDAILVKIEGNWLTTKVETIAFDTFDLAKELTLEIKDACSYDKSSVELITSLNFKLGYAFADAVKQLCKQANFPLEDIDFIASHGQTIFHIPKAYDNFIPSTLQIGEPAIIAYETGVQVISNFRTMDMAAGGEGAPLVPYTEYLLYHSTEKTVVLQNIGGIGNVTCIPKDSDLDALFAFDTGPGNMIIDEVVQQLFGQPYDDGGKIAASGTVHADMFASLIQHPYIDAPIPKTTGREMFGAQYVANILTTFKDVAPADIVATVTMFTAYTIAQNYEQFIIPKHPIDAAIIGGGGAHNKTLLADLQKLLPSVEILTQDAIGFSSDAKEALAFVVLGNETLHQHFSNAPSATGAKERVILGNITPAPYKQ